MSKGCREVAVEKLLEDCELSDEIGIQGSKWKEPIPFEHSYCKHSSYPGNRPFVVHKLFRIDPF